MLLGLGTQGRKPVPQQSRHPQAVHRVHQVVGIAAGVNIAHGPINLAARHAVCRDDFRGVDEPRTAGQDSGVAGVLQQRRRPADFQFEAHLDVSVAGVQRPDETRLGNREMGVLGALGKDGHDDFGTADFLGQAAQFRNGGANPQRLCGQRARHQQAGQCGENCQQASGALSEQDGFIRHAPLTPTLSRQGRGGKTPSQRRASSLLILSPLEGEGQGGG